MMKTNKQAGKIIFTVAFLLMTLFFPQPVAAEAVPDETQPPPQTQWAAQDPEPSVARIVLSSYSFVESQSLDTAARTLRITLTNEGTADAYSVLLTFRDDSLAYLPAQGTSNQIYIPGIAAGESLSRDIQLTAAKTTVDKYTLFFTVEYLYEGAASQNSFYIAGLTDAVQSTVEVLQFEVRGEADATGETPMYTAVANHTSQALNNVSLQVSDVQGNLLKTIDIGTLDANGHFSGIYNVPLRDGQVQQVRIFVAYEDENGETYNTGESVFTLYGYQADTDGGALAEFETYTQEIIIHLVLIAIVSAMIVTLIIRKSRPDAGKRRTKAWRKTR